MRRLPIACRLSAIAVAWMLSVPAVLAQIRPEPSAFGAKTRDATAIARQLAERGVTRIIVELAAPGVEAARRDDDMEQARAVVGSAQAALLERHLGADGAARIAKSKRWSLRRMRNLPMLAMTVDQAELAALAADGAVTRIWEDRIDRPTLTESVPLIGMPPAYAKGADGSGTIVAILDTGVDRTHPFLAGQVTQEACFSSNVPDFQSTTVCPNGQETQTGAGAGVNCPDDVVGCDHGTHVAGIAAGDRASGTPRNGVAKGARIFAVQVFSRFDNPSFCGSEPCALSWSSDQIAGLDHVLSRVGAIPEIIAAANMSLGGSPRIGACDTDSRKPAIDALRAAKVATAIASGNDGDPGAVSAPGCISTAITVGSTTKSDAISDFSNMSELVDLLAPGSGINSSVPGNGFEFFSGTSMATPHVAGAFAALRSRVTDASVDAIEEALEATGRAVTDTRGGALTRPRIRVNLALERLLPAQSLTVTPADPQLISGPLGGPFDRKKIKFRLSNEGTTAVEWRALDGRRWAGVEPKHGTLAPGESVYVRVYLFPRAYEKPRGRYLDVVKFINKETHEIIKRPFTLHVARPVEPAQD